MKTCSRRGAHDEVFVTHTHTHTHTHSHTHPQTHSHPQTQTHTRKIRQLHQTSRSDRAGARSCVLAVGEPSSLSVSGEARDPHGLSEQYGSGLAVHHHAGSGRCARLVRCQVHLAGMRGVYFLFSCEKSQELRQASQQVLLVVAAVARVV